MPRPSHRSHKQIAEAFITELQAFKHGGYRFPDSGKELFEGTQREAFDAYLDGLKANHREGYYEIPTGVGKTALFIAIIGCYLRATENIPDAPRVLIHEPTTDLVIQTAQSFADFLPDIAKRIEADDDCGREIDWANSHIDVHYTRRHGAENKPKVLITTYQGQAADQRKPKEQRIHNPAEFGLVIHDEAHYLTGRKFGPAAVDNFKGAIQLGVTATPEYAEDKTLANKLGHRYYHLPLNTAIERGDLCHVRPIVLKTHLLGKHAINIERAKQFFEQRQGRPLSNNQLEQLLNQEARNQAIIKAYLAGSHPDTGERFLGQTGMIFAGGITHCNDFILHTERVLNQPAYRPITKWLRDEGVALIAPIHSDMPRGGVELNFGGQRRKCTKDEIKELHRQGKILLIISDQELKLGSDFPMDSFIVDAVDRFSVPDATQRMGRGFRVNRGDERRNLKPIPDKSCAAINVIDETTHEMYRGTPHHPIHAIEILNGAEHRPPGRRTGALTRFKNHPPEVSEGLEALGFEFIHDAEAIRSIAQTFADNKKRTAPDGWFSGSQLMKTYIGNSTLLDARIREYAAAKEQHYLQEGMPKEKAAHRVSKEWAGVYVPRTGGTEAWHVSPAALRDMHDCGMLRPRSTKAPLAPAGWVTVKRLIDDYIGGNAELTRKVRDHAAEKELAYMEDGMSKDQAALKVFNECAGIYTMNDGRHQTWHLSPAARKEMQNIGLLVPRDAHAEKAPTAPDGWETAGQLRQEYIGNQAHMSARIQEYAAAKRQGFVQGGMAEARAAKAVCEEWAGIYTAKDSHHEVWHVSPAGKREMHDKGMLRPRSEKAPLAPDSWLTGKRLKADYVGGNVELTEKIRDYSAAKVSAYVLRGMPKEKATKKVFTEWAGVYSAKGVGKETWHISPEGIAELQAQGRLAMRALGHSPEQYADVGLKSKTIRKKDVSPESDDLKRTGRSRSRSEE